MLGTETGRLSSLRATLEASGAETWGLGKTMQAELVTYNAVWSGWDQFCSVFFQNYLDSHTHTHLTHYYFIGLDFEFITDCGSGAI